VATTSLYPDRDLELAKREVNQWKENALAWKTAHDEQKRADRYESQRNHYDRFAWICAGGIGLLFEVLLMIYVINSNIDKFF
jgi:hypothetical protein